MLLTRRVIELIADHTRTDPADLPTPLAEVIDSDAFDQLFADRDTDGPVTFMYEGFTVAAGGDGAHEVHD